MKKSIEVLKDEDMLKLDPKLGGFFVGYQYFLVPMKEDYFSEFTVWYPTLEKPKQAVFYRLYPFECKKDASFVSENLSTIIISHGSGGTQYDQLYLIKHFVSHGYAVISIQHKNTGISRDAGWKFLVGMPNDINAVINWTEDCKIKDLFDTDHLAIIGFSAGAFASLLLAGARPNFENDDSFRAFLPSINNVDFSSFYNQKVKSLILLAPPLAKLFSKSELQKIKIPTLMMAAGNDQISGTECIEHYYSSLSSLDKCIKLESAEHYSFNNKGYHEFLQKIIQKNCNNDAKKSMYHRAINNHCLQFIDSSFLDR